MADIFRRSYTQPIPPGAELIDVNGTPSAKFKQRGRRKATIAPLTDDGQQVRVASPFWYARVKGKVVKLFADEMASRQRLAELVRKTERQESGLRDPFEEHRKRPIAEQIDDWASDLRNRGKTKSHIRSTTGCVKRLVEACKFERIDDVSASRIEKYLADLRADGPALRPLDRMKDEYTKAEVAAALGINKTAIGSLVKRHRLQATGNGKARRYPRATVEALRERRDRGVSIKTSNLYLSGMKAFCNWLVRDRRIDANPIIHLKGLDPQHDRRHDRRFLDEAELGSVINAAEKSAVEFRGLTGTDRAMLYRLACTSGFRASELAALCPKDFGQAEPIVTLSGSYTRNKKPAEQPLPEEVAELLREYLAAKPANKPVWPGKWYESAVDMLRIDLDAAGIPYAVEGPDGPAFADFHSLRHSYVALLDKMGVTLKEAMQLARHSDPKLTMKIYGKARRHDLAGAAGRLPSFKKQAEPTKESKTG